MPNIGGLQDGQNLPIAEGSFTIDYNYIEEECAFTQLHHTKECNKGWLDHDQL